MTFQYKTNLKKRIAATLIDYLIIILFSCAYIMLFGHNTTNGGKGVNGFLALPLFVVEFVYFVGAEAYWGATLGHQLFYLKVLTVDRKNIGFAHAFKRRLLDPIDILLYGIPAIIAIRKTEKHQRLGDLFAKTIIVDTKDSKQF